MTKGGDRLSLGEVDQELGNAFDVFICSSSYEDRCLSIPLHIRRESIDVAVVVENQDIPEVAKNGERLCEHFGPLSRRVVTDTGKPIASADAMFGCLDELTVKERPGRVAIDITTFTHEQLLIILGILRRVGCDRLRCLYSGAAAYMTAKPQWLSQGIAETRSVLGYSGDLEIAAGSKLVMLVGFEWERARRLIDAYDPTRLALGLGRRSDAIEETHYETNHKFYERLARSFPDAERFEFSCNDAITTGEIVREQCKGEHLAPGVAPLNTKISTVGAALAAFEDRRIQLCYAQAAVYNCASYSRPGKFYRSFDVELKPERE